MFIVSFGIAREIRICKKQSDEHTILLLLLHYYYSLKDASISKILQTYFFLFSVLCWGITASRFPRLRSERERPSPPSLLRRGRNEVETKNVLWVGKALRVCYEGRHGDRKFTTSREKCEVSKSTSGKYILLSIDQVHTDSRYLRISITSKHKYILQSWVARSNASQKYEE